MFFEKTMSCHVRGSAVLDRWENRSRGCPLILIPRYGRHREKRNTGRMHSAPGHPKASGAERGSLFTTNYRSVPVACAVFQDPRRVWYRPPDQLRSILRPSVTSFRRRNSAPSGPGLAPRFRDFASGNSRCGHRPRPPVGRCRLPWHALILKRSFWVVNLEQPPVVFFSKIH